MSIVKGTLLISLCFASFACRNKPQAGSKDSSGERTIDGTGHTGDVAPVQGKPGDPSAAPGTNAAGAPSPSAQQGSGAVPNNTTAPSGTGNSNTDMASPSTGSATH